MNLRYVVQTRAMQALFSVAKDNRPYDPNKPEVITVTTPVTLMLGAGADFDDDYYEDEVDEGFEMPMLFGMGEVPEMGRTVSPVVEATLQLIPSPAPLALILPEVTAATDDDNVIELEVSPKGEKPKTGPLPALTVDESVAVSETPYDLGAAVYHKGKAARITIVQPTVRRVHYVETNNPPYAFPKIEELMTREHPPLPTAPVLLKGVGLAPIDTDMISLDGRTDKGAEARAFAVARLLAEMDLWDGFQTRIRIVDAYAVHDRVTEEKYVSLAMETRELMVRAASVADVTPEPAPSTVIPEPTPVTLAVMPLPESPFRGLWRPRQRHAGRKCRCPDKVVRHTLQAVPERGADAT